MNFHARILETQVQALAVDGFLNYVNKANVVSMY